MAKPQLSLQIVNRYKSNRTIPNAFCLLVESTAHISEKAPQFRPQHRTPSHGGVTRTKWPPKNPGVVHHRIARRLRHGGGLVMLADGTVG
jgi:hypothetical protein